MHYACMQYVGKEGYVCINNECVPKDDWPANIPASCEKGKDKDICDDDGLLYICDDNGYYRANCNNKCTVCSDGWGVCNDSTEACKGHEPSSGETCANPVTIGGNVGDCCEKDNY